MKVHSTEIRVPYADTDRMGIVYHTNYIKYFETGRAEFLRAAGYPYAQLEAEGIWLPVMTVQCEYKSPATFDDVLVIETRVGEIKSASIVMVYKIYKKETGELVAKGETKHPITDKKLRLVRLKNVKPELLELLLKACE